MCDRRRHSDHGWHASGSRSADRSKTQQVSSRSLLSVWVRLPHAHTWIEHLRAYRSQAPLLSRVIGVSQGTLIWDAASCEGKSRTSTWSPRRSINTRSRLSGSPRSTRRRLSMFVGVIAKPSEQRIRLRHRVDYGHVTSLVERGSRTALGNSRPKQLAQFCYRLRTLGDSRIYRKSSTKKEKIRSTPNH